MDLKQVDAARDARRPDERQVRRLILSWVTTFNAWERGLDAPLEPHPARPPRRREGPPPTAT